MQQRQTIQKQIVLETLEKMRDEANHFSIDDIYGAIKESYSSISKTTVYRNVRALAESGTIAQVILEDGIERYDLLTHDHHHFSCQVCEGIFDVEIDGLLDFEKYISDKYQHRTDKVNLSFTGVCADCLDSKLTLEQ